MQIRDMKKFHALLLYYFIRNTLLNYTI